MTGCEVPDPLPLRTISVPLAVSQVDGCDCGGLEYHRAASSFSADPPCTIWNLPAERRLFAIDDARGRLKAFTEALNARLREAITKGEQG